MVELKVKNQFEVGLKKHVKDFPNKKHKLT